MEIARAKAVEAAFQQFKSRRAGLVRALTIDADKLFLLCDPGKDELCLYGLLNKEWEVKPPVEVVPPAIPEPATGINFARDVMSTKEWFSMVARHSDAWLLSVASCYGATNSMLNDKSVRAKLFTKINNLPTLLEVMNDYMETVQKGKSRVTNSIYKSGNCSKSVTEEVQLLEEDNDICGACGEIYAENEFWIFCDMCKKWFHGQCVNVTPAKADHIKIYRCPSCNKKRTRA